MSVTDVDDTMVAPQPLILCPPPSETSDNQKWHQNKMMHIHFFFLLFFTHIKQNFVLQIIMPEFSIKYTADSDRHA